MVRKILLGIVALLILAGAGTYMLIKTKGDVLLQKFSAYVEETTGAPLLMDELPTLTFFPQPGLNLGRASWGREESALSVRFERASVRVSAKSLLRGKLDITDMEVDGLAVVSRSAAAKAAPAAAPASSAAPAPVSDKNEAKDAARLEAVLTRILTVAPNALTVRDGHVSLLRSDGASTEFSHVDLNLKNVRPGADTGLTLKADIRGLGPDFSGVLELTAGAALSDSNLTVSLRKAVFTPTAGLPFDTPLSLSGDGNYQLRNGSLTLRSLTLSGPDLHVTASGDAAALPALLRDPLHAAGPASLEFSAKGSPRAVLAALALPVPDSDPAALTAAALTGRLDLDKGILKISSLDGSLDSISLGGALECRLDPPSLAGELQVGDVRLDSYLSASAPEVQTADQTKAASRPAPKGAETSKSAEPAVPAWKKWPDLNLALRVRSLEAAGVRIEEIQTRLEGKNGTYTLNPLTCRAFGSPVTAALTAAVDPSAAPLAADVTVNLSAPQIDLKQLSAALLPSLPLEGTATLNTTLACFTADPLPSLSGKGSLSAAPLTVNIDVLPPNAPAAADVARHTRFDKAMLTFNAAKGIVTITDCTMSAAKISAAGKGVVDLPARTLDLSGTVQLPGLAVLPVRLTGPLSAPTYSLNARTTFEAVDRTLKEQGVDLGQEIQKGLGRLFRKK